ncbi:cation diffusion facilitator family transporter [Alicyclobacillus tolerans]|uniref:cation diffusion facilitator family transporter n=1 Tax=Alicyclobacillus tolerans TaxID=90970 RepID=UPI001F47C227|nr:cation diffusion facilitator family transporter [Alicyclobacillus tolerans]MCF8565220.1 cation diffusion facilitator family transporter [Alicyclobacillus tolerans]
MGPVGHTGQQPMSVDHRVDFRKSLQVLAVSLLGMLVTASLQAAVTLFTGSTALFADAIHNFADALTSVPLGIAFILSQRPPSRHFLYGLDRSEDIAGLIIVFIIFISALFTGYMSYDHIVHARTPSHLPSVVAAAVLGFIGNEAVAVYRIRMGRKMGSVALVADGEHAKIDGLTSLAVILGAVGTWFGFPIVDPIVGLVITVMILFIVKDSAKLVFLRLLDGIEPSVMEQIERVSSQVEGVCSVTGVRGRWVGHQVHTEVSVSVHSELTVREGHEIAKRVILALQEEVPHVASVQVHVDPLEEEGVEFHAYLHKP